MCAGTGDGVSSGVSWSEWNRAESRKAVADPSSTCVLVLPLVLMLVALCAKSSHAILVPIGYCMDAIVRSVLPRGTRTRTTVCLCPGLA